MWTGELEGRDLGMNARRKAAVVFSLGTAEVLSFLKCAFKILSF